METKNRPNGKAIASLVVSCISVLNCCVWYLAIACGVIGVVLGVLALRDDYEYQKDLAVAGVVVGGVGFALGVVSALLFILLFSASGDGTIQNGGTDTVLMLFGIFG